MAQPDEHLPLNRSYVEQRIGQLVGIFQIDRQRPADSSQARALPVDLEDPNELADPLLDVASVEW